MKIKISFVALLVTLTQTLGTSGNNILAGLPHDKFGEQIMSASESNTERQTEYFSKMMEAHIRRKRSKHKRFSYAHFKCVRPGLFALTFDDGPSYNGWTETVLDVLAQKGVKATFFVSGGSEHDGTNLTSDVRKQALLRRIHHDGHQIASHTFTHGSLTANRTREDIITDLTNIADAVRDIAGLNLTIMRPPYGDYNETVLRLIEEVFGYEMIIWNVDTKDWFYKDNIGGSFKAYLKKMGGARVDRDSYIALHHDPVVRSGEFAAMAIEFVRSKGFQFVTVGECIGIDH